MAALARIFSAALFLLLPVAAFAGPAEGANEAVDRWVAAYNSNDLNAITNMYTPDAILLGRVHNLEIFTFNVERRLALYPKKGERRDEFRPTKAR